MTETENKYFAVNIYDENSISFHKTEEDAQAWLDAMKNARR
ncbi:hypothetical protein ACFGWP_03645 [Pasteurella multocida]